MKPRLLITGGAGFIGSVLTSYLIDNGYEVVVIDDLSTGHISKIDSRAKLIKASILDKSLLTEALTGIDVVIHCAAKSLVEESVKKPELYREINTIGTKVLLESMVRSGVKKIIFSSTAAVYGEVDRQPISEDASINPSNPYGKSKRDAEILISDFCHEGFAGITFRYFNVSGSYQNSIGELFYENHQNETHLIPKIMKNFILQTEKHQVEIYGNNWPTKDGSCIRDFLHVKDLAHAHLLALNSLDYGVNKVINLGSGIGYSVFDIVREIEMILEAKLTHVISKPRDGDPAVLLASIVKAKTDLGWKPEATLGEIISDSWRGVKQLG
jgi:UDP-glucose 4-epimerase